MSQSEELKTYEVTVVLQVNAKNEADAENSALFEIKALLDDGSLDFDTVEKLS